VEEVLMFRASSGKVFNSRLEAIAEDLARYLDDVGYDYSDDSFLYSSAIVRHLGEVLIKLKGVPAALAKDGEPEYNLERLARRIVEFVETARKEKCFEGILPEATDSDESLF
jgi:hypothetical protein